VDWTPWLLMRSCLGRSTDRGSGASGARRPPYGAQRWRRGWLVRARGPDCPGGGAVSDDACPTPVGAAPAVDAAAERLPFDDDSLGAAMVTMTNHRWRDVDHGLREMRRVGCGPVVVPTVDAPWNPASFAGLLPDLVGEHGSRHRTTLRPGEDRASPSGPTCRRRCSSIRRMTERATRTERLDRRVFGSLPKVILPLIPTAVLATMMRERRTSTFARVSPAALPQRRPSYAPTSTRGTMALGHSLDEGLDLDLGQKLGTLARLFGRQRPRDSDVTRTLPCEPSPGRGQRRASRRPMYVRRRC
jgi:hypothetical protein